MSEDWTPIAYWRNKYLRRSVLIVSILPIYLVALPIIITIKALEESYDIWPSIKTAWRGKERYRNA